MKEEKKITRKEAIKKTGLVAASLVTMMVLLNNNAKANVIEDGHEPGQGKGQGQGGGKGQGQGGGHGQGQGGGHFDPGTSPGHD